MIKSLDLGFDETETTLLAMFSTSHCYLPTHKSPFIVDSKLCIKYYVCVCVCVVRCGVVCMCVCVCVGLQQSMQTEFCATEIC